jgi:hypothetical protein
MMSLVATPAMRHISIYANASPWLQDLLVDHQKAGQLGGESARLITCYNQGGYFTEVVIVQGVGRSGQALRLACYSR